MRVSDDGVGMPLNFVHKDSDTLGLQIVKAITEHQLGGTVELDKSKGTKFLIRFKEPSHGGGGIVRPKIKIPIAEGKAISALFMQRALSNAEYDVCGLITTGEEAAARVKQDKPDLAIMDVILKSPLARHHFRQHQRQIGKQGDQSDYQKNG